MISLGVQPMTSNTTPILLDPQTFPLHGARLIEASAGTGKTYTIANLYLRLLLGHGSEASRHQHSLTVDQILVVTFTEAATAELRDRIRSKIHETRLAFARGVSKDPFIQTLMADTSDHTDATTILLQAEQQMDEAAIYTIHGFCQRMLTQNAFESGSRFNNEFISDEEPLKQQVVADYWRRNFYQLPSKVVTAIHGLYKHPDEIYKLIKSWITGPDIEIKPDVSKSDLPVKLNERMAAIADIKKQWLSIAGELGDMIRPAFKSQHLDGWLEQVGTWAAKDTVSLSYPKALPHFTQSALIKKTNKGKTPPEHPLFEAIEAFLENPTDEKAELGADAIMQCKKALAANKQKQQVLSFDDLLSQLAHAIEHDDEEILSHRIRSLFPVAMIDEFQDTDPLQYQIFQSLYLNNPECGWFMIGDPKQAIYGFRGADIFTYIEARQAVNSHFTLSVNWRSSQAMVCSANQVFASADKPFIYDSDIPFHPVDANPSADKMHWYVAGQKQPAMRYWFANDSDSDTNGDNENHSGKPLSMGAYETMMADATAREISRLLTASQNGDAYFESKGSTKPIQGSDIAILVRKGKQAQLVKQALAKQGIASVYLSNKESVFKTTVAKALATILTGVLAPDDHSLLRAAVATTLMGLDAHGLDQLNHDENQWDSVVTEFRDYQYHWRKRGILPMIRHLMSQRQIAERLLQQPQGEADVTHLMHLSELLQQASLDIDSQHGLLRWLNDAIEHAHTYGTGNDDQIQRLESERNLVQIITIHKSKGLEYDLVFVPFAMGFTRQKTAKYYDKISKTTCLDLTLDKAHLQYAEEERLAEDLRLLYVAVTRAVYGCYMGVGAIKDGNFKASQSHLSALGYALQKGQMCTTEELKAALTAWTDDNPHAVISPLPSVDIPAYQIQDAGPITLSANTMNRAIDGNWRMTSYSGIIRQDPSHQSHHSAFNQPMDLLTLDTDSADDDITDTATAVSDDDQYTIFQFPKGARPGTFLHTLFEEVIFTEPANSPHNTQVIKTLMETEQYEDAWLPVLQQLMDTVLATPLDGKALKLNQKTSQQCLVEMEFLLPIKVLQADALNQVVMTHDALSAQAGALGFETVKGMLKGFIDLIFEDGGRYYVLDWKSNYLGDNVSCYHQNALANAMADHRYDLQYQIYALALHRFLRSRLPDYQYDVHFGGVYYLFLRGMDGNSQNGIFYTKPSEAFLMALDALIDGNLPAHSVATEVHS